MLTFSARTIVINSYHVKKRKKPLIKQYSIQSMTTIALPVSLVSLYDASCSACNRSTVAMINATSRLITGTSDSSRTSSIIVYFCASYCQARRRARYGRRSLRYSCLSILFSSQWSFQSNACINNT